MTSLTQYTTQDKQMAGLFDVQFSDVLRIRETVGVGQSPKTARFEIRNMEGLRYDQMDQLARILGTERINFSWIRDAHERGESTYYGARGTLLLHASYA